MNLSGREVAAEMAATETDRGTFDADAEDDGALGEALGSDDEQLMIPGTAVGLSTKAGGPDPTTSEFSLKGGAIAVSGQFAVGDVLTLQVEVCITEVSFRGKRDADGKVVTVARVHKGVQAGVARVDQA